MLFLERNIFILSIKANMSDPVKLIVTFSSDVNLDDVTRTLKETYLFVQHIQKCGKNELLISFDSMSDLLEIDFIEQFGALSTKVKNSNSFCIEMKEGQNSSDDEMDSSTNFASLPNNMEKFESENFPKHRKERQERLTSLEDEVGQQEEMLRKLALFEEEQYVSRMQEEKDQIIQEQEESQDLQEKEPKQPEKQSIWGPIVNGVLLTSLLVSGVKAIRFFFG